MKTSSQFRNLRDALDDIRAKYNYLITEEENEILSDAYDLADHQYDFLKEIESNVNFHDCKADAHRCRRLIDECEEALNFTMGERTYDYMMFIAALHILNTCINDTLEALEAE